MFHMCLPGVLLLKIKITILFCVLLKRKVCHMGNLKSLHYGKFELLKFKLRGFCYK